MQGVGQSYYTCTLIIYCTHYFIRLNRSMIQQYIILFYRSAILVCLETWRMTVTTCQKVE